MRGKNVVFIIMSWVKLHTQLLDSRVFANEGLLKVWIYCLCRANRGKAFVPVTTGRGQTDVELKPGQFIFGRNRAAQKLGMSSSTVWKRMNKLKNMGNVDIKSNSHYSIVSICKWDTYQHVPIEKEQAKEQPSNRQVTGKEQPSNTDKSKETNKNKESNGRFTPPTLEEVLPYMKERGGSHKEAEKFIDFYQSKDWYVGKNKMKDWKASVRNWTRSPKKDEQELPQYLKNYL